MAAGVMARIESLNDQSSYITYGLVSHLTLTCVKWTV